MIFEYLILPYDYIIVCIAFIFIIISFLKGFIQSLLGLLTWVGSIIITVYSYNSLSLFISKQLIQIDILSNYETITDISGLIISIPLIFLISLFILRKLRKLISSDLDKQILGVIFDKLFGLVYGFIFSYLIFATILYGLEKFIYFNSFYYWILENSFILKSISNINNEIIKYVNPEFIQE